MLTDQSMCPSKRRNSTGSSQISSEPPGVTIGAAAPNGGAGLDAATLRRLAADVAAGRLEPDAIDEGVVESRLYTAQWPDPELLIRPGGESRLSNFLLFQVAHTELYLSDVFWPDFGAAEFARALAAYRERRLIAAGGT